MSEVPTAPPDSRLRVNLRLETGILAWAEGHSGPGANFYLVGGALEAALGRLQDECNFIKERCRARRLTFDAATFWRVHEDLVAAAKPRGAGRPFAGDHSERRKVIAHISTELLQWAGAHAEPNGPFVPDNVAAHAVETGLRVLKACEVTSPARISHFPFDGEKLWDTYAALRKRQG